MSDRLSLKISAIDTVMFRDGKPFNQADAGASLAASVFPPYPPTLVGAVRAAIWNALGGRKEDWDKTLLGDGTNWQNENNVLGKLEFSAPGVLWDDSPVYRVPLHVVTVKDKEGEKGRSEPKILSPEKTFLDCDMAGGPVRFPAISGEGVKTIESRWVTLKGMENILAGNPPSKEHLIKKTKIWQIEPRTGIGIERDSRTTVDGNLYMASHVRMSDATSLYVEVGGCDKGCMHDRLQPLAGEHRMAEIASVARVGSPKRPKQLNHNRYCVIQLSPLILESMPNPGGVLPNLPGNLVSACLGKPLMIGGWDFKKCRPIAMRQAIPAGSVWFMGVETQEQRAEALNWHLGKIGLATEWGFGQIMIGSW